MLPTDPFFAALAGVLADHVTTGAPHTRSPLPNGYALAVKSDPADPAGDLQVALFAPAVQGAARICTARFSPGTPLSAATRLLARTVRSAPAGAGRPTTRPTPAEVVPHLTVGRSEQRPDDPGLFVTYGRAAAWLHDGRLGVTLGSAASGGSLTFSGPWDALAVAAVLDCALEEFTDARALAAEVAALLPPDWDRVVPDQWHPDAAVILPRHSPGPDDPLGRVFSRELMAVGEELLAACPDLEAQPFHSNEGAAVALRITRRAAAVPKLVKASRLVPPRAGEPAVTVIHSEYLPPGVPLVVRGGPER
ncbi:hypothetical protein ACFC58_06340 [Kitasatospora purpeofusca]|uniref:hypothetical protein n=1 Tax=Kitasatospora purpeofusca TaxID=67352 RepID=UPI0035D9C19D